jgi:hypothetical protein
MPLPRLARRRTRLNQPTLLRLTQITRNHPRPLVQRSMKPTISLIRLRHKVILADEMRWNADANGLDRLTRRERLPGGRAPAVWNGRM